MNIFIERRFELIREGALSVLLNEKLNDTAQRILWEEAVHMCECVTNGMATTGSTTSPFEIFYGEKPKIIGLFLGFDLIG